MRRLNLVNKLRAIKKIESEVQALRSAPLTEHILNLNLSSGGPLPELDTQYVGKVPRKVMAIEHALTQKLIELDGISGGGDLVRQRRKALVSAIEGILSTVDTIKKAYQSSPDHPPKADKMETESTTPTNTTDNRTTTQPGITTATQMDTEDTLRQKNGSGPTISDAPMVGADKLGGNGSHGSSFVDGMSSMAIQDVSDQTTPARVVQSVIPAPAFSEKQQIPTLKSLCYNLCDSLIKKSLL